MRISTTKSTSEMRATTFVSLLLTLYTSLALAAHDERTVDIFAWPLSAPKSQTLARISYNSTIATVKSYTAPKISSSDDIVRVGFYHDSGSWSGIATAASNLAAEKDKKLQLLLNTNGDLYHVGFKASDLGSHSRSGKGTTELGVEVVKMQKGPTPHLNKPVVLNAEGKVDEKEPEKSFFQKCVFSWKA